MVKRKNILHHYLHQSYPPVNSSIFINKMKMMNIIINKYLYIRERKKRGRKENMYFFIPLRGGAFSEGFASPIHHHTIKER
jgi:hypothetical protein